MKLLRFFYGFKDVAMLLLGCSGCFLKAPNNKKETIIYATV